MEEPKRSPPRKRGLRGFLGDLAEFAETVGNVVQSAGELLLDTELRKKGATLIAQQADKTINEVQREIEARAEKVQQGARARIGAGAQRLQSVLRNIERQIQEFQKQQQQWDLQAELEHHHKLPVDIQVGDQVYEDMPQELRTRFWYVLLERPDLAKGLTRRGIRRVSESASFGSGRRAASAARAHLSVTSETTAEEDNTAAVHHISAEAAATAVAAAMGNTIEDLCSGQQPVEGGGTADEPLADSTAAGEAGDADSDKAASVGSPFAAYCSSPAPVDAIGELQARSADAAEIEGSDAAAAIGTAERPPGGTGVVMEAAAGGGDTAEGPVNYRSTDDAPDVDDVLAQQSIEAGAAPAAPNAADAQDTAVAGAADGEAAAAGTAGSCEGGSTSKGGAVAAIKAAWSDSANCASVASAASALSAPSPWMSVQPAGSNASSLAVRPIAPNPWEHLAAGSSSSRNSRQDVTAGAAVTTPSAAADGDAGWEMVNDDVPSDVHHFTEDTETLDSLRSLVEHLSSADSLDASRACQAAVFQAMLNEVPWLAGEGVPPEIDPHGEYAKLLEAGCGSVEDIIARDVPRTFPEHPLFSCHEGQQRLLRVLKAYAAADPEVGYCQGMAFAAGILLMYLPEEPAFRLYHRLMTSGPTLRRLYLPGLDFLKMELSRFELLLSTHTPQLHQHLLDAGLPALLYAAQWLMTCYSCPFPVHVAARVLDILLQSDDASILLRLGLAVITALQDQLLDLDDFEELITHLKVKPLSWPLHMHRKVLYDAMNSPASDAELAASTVAVQKEFQRLGRFSSFSSYQLRPLHPNAGSDGAAAASDGCSASSGAGRDGVRHELVPGPMGPRSAAATAAAEAAEQAAKASGSCSSSSGSHQGSDGSSASSAAAEQQVQLVQQQQQQGLQQQEGQQSQQQQQQPVVAAAAGTTESGVLGELDATLIDLMADMDLALRSESEDSQVVSSTTG